MVVRGTGPEVYAQRSPLPHLLFSKTPRARPRDNQPRLRYSPRRMIRTKIVATMGPACGDVETLLRLFEAGADVCRLNFSHGSLEAHLQNLRNIREAAARYSHPIAVLGDLCGPKIRLGQVADQDGTGGMPIAPGDELMLQRAVVVGSNGRVSSTYPHLIDDVQVGHRLYVEDGL